ncbi:MAG: hypothetical protein K2M42_11690 [Oscillospiraceae bacterium]|nr:hypothetical protein [Oscillospiraceae bacterium]
MCWWCGDPTCIDGKKCRNARARNDLLNSNTFRGAVRRVERATDQKVTYAPGMPWDGRRPSFLPGVRDAVMRGPNGAGGGICPICGKAINGTHGHADHKTPWKDYTMESARDAMREHGKRWTGGAIPDDFARIMSSDPKNLQATHASCNESKSNSMPGRSIGDARKERQEAQAKEAALLREEQRKRTLQQQRERDERSARRDSDRDSLWSWRRGPGPDRDPGGAGILA